MQTKKDKYKRKCRGFDDFSRFFSKSEQLKFYFIFCCNGWYIMKIQSFLSIFVILYFSFLRHFSSINLIWNLVLNFADTLEKCSVLDAISWKCSAPKEEIFWTGLGLILKTGSKKSSLEIIYQIAFLYRMVYHKGVFWAPCFSRFILMTCQVQ